jgi:hypothetical protein
MRVPQVSERIKEAPAQALRGVFAGIGQLLLITDKLRNKATHQDVPRARTPEASETVTDTTVTSPGDNGAGTAAAPAGSAPAEAAPAPAEAAPAPAEAAPAPAEAVTESETVAADPAAAKATAAKPATTRRTAAKPVADKPVTAKPPAKPATAKPAAAKPTTPRRTAAKAAAAEAAESAGEAAAKPPKRQSSRNFDKTGNVRVLGDETDTPATSAAPEPSAAPAEPVAPVAAAPEPTAVAEPVAAADPAAAAAAAAPLPNYDELSVASLRARLRNLDVAQVGQLAEYERAHAARADVLTMFERRIAKLEAEA